MAAESKEPAKTESPLAKAAPESSAPDPSAPGSSASESFAPAPSTPDPAPKDASMKASCSPEVSFGVEIPEDIDPMLVFRLMGQMLPLEVCLYHRIVPLRQAQGRLTLGMVDPSDEEALTYVERLVAYQGLIMEPILLAGPVHQSLLSAYLNHVGKPAATDAAGQMDAARHQAELDRLDRTEIEPDWWVGSDRLNDHLGSNGRAPEALLFSDELSEDEEMESAELACPDPKLTRAEGISAESTLCVEAPETVEPLEAKRLEQRAANLAAKPEVNERATLHLPHEDSLVMEDALDGMPDAALLFSTEGTAIGAKASALPPTPPKPALEFPALHVEIQHLMEPMEAIAQLPAPKFLAELFGRILAGGISRVLMGSNGGPGRIAWDRNGVAQLALKHIEPQAFRALVAELKAVTGLPSGTTERSMQWRVLRSYEGQPVMLRLQLEPTGLNAMNAPQGPGEKIQIQVLRGARLIVHEQQRLEQLQKEAIATAKLLKQKFAQIEQMTQALPVLEPDFEALEQLTMLVHENVLSLPTRG